MPKPFCLLLVTNIRSFCLVGWFGMVYNLTSEKEKCYKNTLKMQCNAMQWNRIGYNTIKYLISHRPDNVI